MSGKPNKPNQKVLVLLMPGCHCSPPNNFIMASVEVGRCLRNWMFCNGWYQFDAVGNFWLRCFPTSGIYRNDQGVANHLINHSMLASKEREPNDPLLNDEASFSHVLL